MASNSKTTTDHLMQLDIRQLIKSGALKIGSSSTLSWRIGDTLIGSIQYSVISHSAMVLSYLKRVDDEWLNDTEQLEIVSTPCHLGGSRQWFLCPECQQRVAIVYFKDTRLGCRHCHDLAYASQNERPIDRQWRKARKIRERLGASSNVFLPANKPKGMHYKTFERLQLAELAANKAVLHSVNEVG